MSSEELAEIEAGAARYPIMASELVKKLCAEIRRVQAAYDEKCRASSTGACTSPKDAV